MSKFHAPYNFIPVTGKINGEDSARTSYEKIKNGEDPFVRHDIWHKDAKHGRIICKVHLDTPTIVGGSHEPSDTGEPTRVHPYKDIEDNIALPANSLRGMVGSVAETLSQSALRVLEDRRYSVRKPMEENISAMGILVKSKDSNREFDLIPLTLPILTKYPPQTPSDNDWWQKWVKLFKLNVNRLVDFLPVYVAGYHREEKKGKSKARLYSKIGTFIAEQERTLGKEKPRKSLDSFQFEDNPDYYYALLNDREEKVIGGMVLGALGKLSERSIISAIDFQSIQDVGYTRGILRIFDIAGKADALQNKQYEFFIPWDERINKPDSIPVLTSAVDEFCLLADEQARLTKKKSAEPKRPFTLKGYPEWKEGDKPRVGDLVFFDINKELEVTEISFSSIWRKAIDDSAFDFFRAINPNVLPLGHDKRDKLTPAECLFGVVEERTQEGNKSARALASRLRFSDGRNTSNAKTLNHEVTLKILSSPKPPSPAMYFHPQNQRGTYIPKVELNKAAHRPNGRKVYLHHREQEVRQCPWESSNPKENANQKMRCTPVAAGETFFFHIDFDNLSELELGLLIHSLTPGDNFRHRLGLGKSLGLGSVTVSIEGVFLIDRINRYGLDAFKQSKYSAVLRNGDKPEQVNWPEWYQTEAAFLCDAEKIQALNPSKELIDNATLKTLCIAGDVNKLSAPVKPLLEIGQPEEQETFKWFVNNDDRNNQNKQALKEIKPNENLPTLQQNR